MMYLSPARSLHLTDLEIIHRFQLAEPLRHALHGRSGPGLQAQEARVHAIQLCDNSSQAIRVPLLPQHGHILLQG
jgi:hypothetical protein